MATYYVDDGGDNTTGATWATAYTSINALVAAVALASGDIVYFGHDSQCQAVNVANLTISGPSSGLPVVFISATTGSTPPTYQQATGNQIDTTEGAFNVTFSGVFALHGIKVVSGGLITINTTAAYSYGNNCIFAPAAGSYLNLGTVGKFVFENTIIDLSADGTTARPGFVINVNSTSIFKGLSFVNAAYRTGVVVNASSQGNCRISGGDFSGFTNATTCEISTNSVATTVFENIKTNSTWSANTGTPTTGKTTFINCGSADQPVSILTFDQKGQLSSSSSIYRTSGATVESTPTAWQITTSAVCSVDSPFYSEYIYGTIDATGSKTFDVFVTNDTADLTDAECWLEVEYKATASSGQWTLVSDKIATRTTTAVAQTDDVTSTWNGTGPAFTYKQKLSVTATVNTTGLYRARVAVGKASVLSSSYLYIDPLVTVS